MEIAHVDLDAFHASVEKRASIPNMTANPSSSARSREIPAWSRLRHTKRANDSFWPLGDTRKPDFHALKASASRLKADTQGTASNPAVGPYQGAYLPLIGGKPCHVWPCDSGPGLHIFPIAIAGFRPETSPVASCLPFAVGLARRDLDRLRSMHFANLATHFDKSI
jgi:hypothetical protein